MKKELLSIVCTLSLIGASAAYADNAQLKSCTIENSSSPCVIDLQAGQDTVAIQFKNFAITKTDQEISCDFNNTNVEMDHVSGVDGDFGSAKVDKNTTGKLFGVLNKSAIDNATGTINIEVNGKFVPDTHKVTVINCHGQQSLR